MMRKLICVICMLSAASCIAEEGAPGQKAYRWIGKDGSMVFSTSPPPEGVKATEFQLRDADVIVPAPPPIVSPSSNLQAPSQGGNSIPADTLKRSIDEAEERLAELRRQYEAGEAPREGERKVFSVGGQTRSKLSEDYFTRRKEEQAAIEAQEKKIENLWKKYKAAR